MELSKLLFEPSDSKKEFVLHIEPFAPLHMGETAATLVKETEYFPSENKIFGAIENMLGLYFSMEDRKILLSMLYEKFPNFYSENEHESKDGKSDFRPITKHLFKCEVINKEEAKKNGHKFFDLKKILTYKNNDCMKSTTIYDSGLNWFFKEYGRDELKIKSGDWSKSGAYQKISRYFTKLQRIQFVEYNKGFKFVVKCESTQEFYELLKNTLEEIRSSAFLGNSESIVEFKIS